MRLPTLLALFLLAPLTAQALEPCPRDATRLRPGENLTCTCIPAAIADSGPVAGNEVYTAESRICRAALHAGAVTRQGGVVTLRALAGLSRHVGAARHGVRSISAGPTRLSFTFVEEPGAGPRLCPDSMVAYTGSATRLACLCPGDAALRSATVWGNGPYTSDSDLCRAALHAGAVPITGGEVRVAMGPGQPAFPASQQNAVQTREFGEFGSSFTFEGPPNATPGPPVQAPVLAALQREGQVALYIPFRPNSAELDRAALPVLTQLREALLTLPGFRLRLVGHTDNQGSAAPAMTLSLRRAQAVRTWLIEQGIAAPRLTAEGKGQSEPVADNATEAGRSLNRRIDAVRTE